jgi:quercetin dioxygenase-like cupin family protein
LLLERGRLDMEKHPAAEIKGSVPLDPELAKRCRLLKKRDFLFAPRYDLPLATTPPYVRGLCDGLRATNGYVHLVQMPFGQRTPRHDFGAEHIIVPIRGSVDFVTDTERFSLDPLDALFIPANLFYEYMNVGEDEVWFVDVVIRFDEWPTKGRYPEVEKAG